MTPTPPPTTEGPTPAEYDTAARICVDESRDAMIETFEQLPNGERLVAALADIARYDGVTDVTFYFDETEASLLNLYAPGEAIAPIDVLAHSAGFRQRLRYEVDPGRWYLGYDLPVEAWQTAPTNGQLCGQCE